MASGEKPRRPGISKRVARGRIVFGFATKEDDPSWVRAQEMKGSFERERGAAGAVRQLEDMTEDEIRRLEQLYGCKVKRPRRRRRRKS